MMTNTNVLIASSLKQAPKVQVVRLAFYYQFADGLLSGVMEGDYITRCPNLTFNLRDMRAQYETKAGELVLRFDQVYGQCSLDRTEALFSGSCSQSGVLFSLNNRGQEAVIFDGQDWLEQRWNSLNWSVRQIQPVSTSLPRVLPLRQSLRQMRFA
ncbi:MAG: hypothetical protein AAGF66_16880 [Cyanobacteria bacterium P01_H01_bin.119]